jgi:hypothetical protein
VLIQCMHNARSTSVCASQSFISRPTLWVSSKFVKFQYRHNCLLYMGLTMNLLKMAYCSKKVVHGIKYNLFKPHNFHLNCLIFIFHSWPTVNWWSALWTTKSTNLCWHSGDHVCNSTFISAASEHKDNDVCEIAKDIFLNCVLHFEMPENLYSGIWIKGITVKQGAKDTDIFIWLWRLLVVTVLCCSYW